MNIDKSSQSVLNPDKNQGVYSQSSAKTFGGNSFQDALKDLTSDINKDVSNKNPTEKSNKSEKSEKSEKNDKPETSAKTEKAQEQKVAKEAETKDIKESKDADKVKDSDKKLDENKKTDTGNSTQHKNPAISGSVNTINQENQDYEALSDNLKTFMKANGLWNVAQLNQHMQTISTNADLYTSAPMIDYKSINMSDDDAMFFATLVQKTDMSMQSIAGEFQKSAETNLVNNVQKNANVSATLMNALSESVKTNQPFRIDFDKNISVIIKVDKDGNINAKFIPGDKAVEAYLRENIGFLKQRFDEQNISYSDLSYNRSKQEQEQQENKKRNNKENDNE